MGLAVFLVLGKGNGNHFFKFFIQLGFFIIPPNPVKYRIAFHFFGYNIIHLPIVFKFFGMLPPQFCLCFLFCEFQKNQFRFVHSRDHLPFNFPPDGRFFKLKIGVNCNHGREQHKQKRYAYYSFFQRKKICCSPNVVKLDVFVLPFY